MDPSGLEFDMMNPPENYQGQAAQGAQTPGAPLLPDSIVSPLDTRQREQTEMEGSSGDPVLDQLMGMEPVIPLYPTKRPDANKTKKPSVSLIKTICNSDYDRFSERLYVMAEDVAMYRQHTSGKPLGFHPSRERAVKSAAISNLVNKLSNMFSGTKVIAKAPYDTTDDEKSSQNVEDAYYYIRKKMKQEYAKSTGGGNLQRDEYFYMLLEGSCVYRVLPDVEDPEYPFNITLLDPATCFPTFGNGKNGMIRMVRKYRATVGAVVTAYAGIIPSAQAKFAKKLGYSNYADLSEYMNEEGDVIEYYDRWWRYVEFMGEVLVYDAHEYGLVPFAVTYPTGEPAGMLTPAGGMAYSPSSDSVGVNFQTGSGFGAGYIQNTQSDMAQKGVSVFHYLKNTHRLVEALNTLLYNEVEKSGNPPTITYTAPHMVGKETPPLDVKRGGTNTRIMNMHDVQGIPTSPRPTDIAPLQTWLQQSWSEGTMPPGAFGSEMGANASGIAIDTLLNSAKDLTLPYVGGWESLQSGVFEICMVHYRDRISPLMSMVYPSKKSGNNELVSLSVDDLNATGMYLEMKVTGIEDSSEANRVQTVNAAIQAGLYSQRYGMEKMNIENPDRMFQDILAEKAMQHELMLQNVMIPSALEARGDEDLLDIWLTTVVAPSMSQMAMPGGAGGAPPEGGGDPMAEMMGVAPPNGGPAQQAGGAQNGMM